MRGWCSRSSWTADLRYAPRPHRIGSGDAHALREHRTVEQLPGWRAWRSVPLDEYTVVELLVRARPLSVETVRIIVAVIATSPSAPPSRLALYLDLIRWNRPAGSYLLLWPTLSALWIAAQGFPGWRLLAVFVAGTFLMRSAGCCVNDVADRDFDRHVKRTAARPVTSGAVSPREALVLGAVLALCAFGLVLLTNPPTILWSFVALAVAIVYPFAKRVVSMPQAVLGVAFSFGIPMAFAAVQGGDAWSVSAMLDAVPPVGWALLVGNLFWVLAYDTEYAMVDRDDDLKIGIRTSAITLGRYDVAGVMLFYAAFVAVWAAVGRHVGLAWPYDAGLGVAAGLAAWHYTLIRGRTREGCFRAFRLNHWVGFAVFAGAVAACLH
ncbi:MAG: 4-hydroxybenzoate octaprenyltransferase [Proteobacteria bacterium]|nr:4-hydroxybenzoate octaprenyltransferase [Pseudomonadota bacterium]